MRTSACKSTLLLQPRVLGFGLFKDWDVGIGVLPEREEVFVGGLRFCTIAAHGVSAPETEMGESSGLARADQTAVIENLLKLKRSGRAVLGRKVSLAAYISRV